MLAVTVGERVINDPDATRFAVDEAAPDHRVSMTTTNHGSLFNTAALRSIGVGDEDADPVGGWYERVPGSLRLSGKLFGYAEVHAYSCLHAEVIEATAVSHIRTTVANALQFGITSIQDMPNGPPKQAENVISGSSRIPTSVPPILEVYPEMNW